MNLHDLELTGINISSLASGVRQGVELSNVTGDVVPLLSSLTCTSLWIDNMELNQAATRSLVRGLEHGVKRLVLDGVRWGPVTLDIQTLVEYDGRGRCGEVTIKCSSNIADTYREMKTWAERINWRVTVSVNYYGRSIAMKRR